MQPRPGGEVRIALVNHTLAPPGRGGAEVCVVGLARYLRDTHDVTLLSGAYLRS
jgi:hypothetical protein